jgi:hypothetical protein
MTVHVLHAGDGYTYLTRQVASGDVARRRGEALTDYYAAEGNPPGRWVDSGRAAMGIEGQVSEAQMKALFGEGLPFRTLIDSGLPIPGNSDAIGITPDQHHPFPAMQAAILRRSRDGDLP